MSDEEEVLPRKRRKVCPKIPYVFGDTIVYGCERCMPLKDPVWFTWMILGKRFGFPRDIANLIGDMLGTSWVPWKTWIPKFDAMVRIPLSHVAIMSRFCCDIYDNCVIFNPYSSHREKFCYCKPHSWTTLQGVWHCCETSTEGTRCIDLRVSSEYPTFTIKVMTNK